MNSFPPLSSFREKFSLLPYLSPLLLFGSFLVVLFLPSLREGRREVEEDSVVMRIHEIPGVHLGFKGPLAGVLWLRTINYFGKHFLQKTLTQERYSLLSRHIEEIVRLDPSVEDPPLFAHDVLVTYGDQVTEVHKILLFALTGSSLNYKLYFRLGYLYASRYRDPVSASLLWEVASYLPSAPLWLRNLVRLAYLRYPMEVHPYFFDLSKEDLPFEFLKEEWDKIRLFFLLKKKMEEMIGRFFKSFGRYPESLEELVEKGFLSGIPRDPWGGQVELSPDGKTVLLSEKAPIYFHRVFQEKGIPLPKELRSGEVLRN